MKLEKLDHKHALTSWLKVILFACLMLAPIMSVVVRSLYVVCNKNAKDSYSDSLIDNQIQITNKDQLQTGAILQFNYHYTSETSYSGWYSFNSCSIDLEHLFTSNNINYNTNYNYDRIRTRNDGYLYIQDSTISGSTTNIQAWGTDILNFSITYDGYFSDNNFNVGYGSTYIYQYQYKINNLDNVFDYSISQIEESQFYNWTQNTAIYNGVEAMTTGLGITGATVPILITYWFLLTVIYIVIDIVINLFTYLTHFLNKKTN